jgi:5S rRNA maturation endonuclease (ribonuclease M5)
MQIPPAIIKDYLSKKFTDFSESGREFRINSIFTEDVKQKLYVNLDTGLWTDFKSNEKGNFYHLISHIENVPYAAAKSYVKRLAFDAGASLFDVSTLNVENKAIEVSRTIAGDVSEFKLIRPKKDINSPNHLVRLAARFALERKLGGFKFYVGLKGRYHQRIIIPYFYEGKPFYFQARTLINRDPKYLNPSKNLYGIKTSEILYPFDKELEYVMVTEGPLDAMSLRAAGFNATCTQGCKMSTVQARALKDKKVIIAYDNDESGSEGFCEAKKRLLTQRNPKLYSLSPPKEFKDWNDFWVSTTAVEFQKYVYSNIFKADWELDVTEQLT